MGNATARPFLSKNFATTISPGSLRLKRWPISDKANARAKDDPQPFTVSVDEDDQATGALDIELEASLLTPGITAKAKSAYRFPLQTRPIYILDLGKMVARPTRFPCNLVPGDLFGSGTISSSTTEGCGLLLERTETARSRFA